MTSSENAVAKILRLTGFIFIAIGIIGGLIYITNDPVGDLFGSFAGISTFFNGVIGGILFLGFAEIIGLLQGIYNQGEKALPGRKQKTPAVKAPIRKTAVSDQERKEIEAFFHEQGLQITRIKATGAEDYFIVDVNGKKELVELGGFKPVIVSSEKIKSDPNLQILLK